MLPFLTINDIIALRAAGYRGLQDIEQRILEVPEPAWVHVLELVRSGIARIQPQALIPRVEPKKVEKAPPPPKVTVAVKAKVKPASKPKKATHKAAKPTKKAAKRKPAKKAKPAKKKAATKRAKKR